MNVQCCCLCGISFECLYQSKRAAIRPGAASDVGAVGRRVGPGLDEEKKKIRSVAPGRDGEVALSLIQTGENNSCLSKPLKKK